MLLFRGGSSKVSTKPSKTGGFLKPPLKEKAELCGDFNATPDL